jgi:hypothetical protein
MSIIAHSSLSSNYQTWWFVSVEHSIGKLQTQLHHNDMNTSGTSTFSRKKHWKIMHNLKLKIEPMYLYHNFFNTWFLLCNELTLPL